MASVFSLANLAGMAYDSKKTVFQEWIRHRSYGNMTGKGFYAELYVNNKKKEASLAIRGTDGADGDMSDFASDAQLALGYTPSQYNYAEKAYSQSINEANKLFGRGHKFYLTGHSLGGGLASLVAAKKGGIPTVTFNAPGMARAYVGGHFLSVAGVYNLYNLDTKKMLHIRSTGDVVSRGTGSHMGKIEDVYVDKWGNDKILGGSRHAAQHSMDNMIESLRTKPWYDKDIVWRA